MTKTLISSTAEKLEDFIKKSQLTQVEIAKKLNVSSAQINLYLNGKYTGDIDTLEKKIESFLVAEKEREVFINRKIQLKFVKTSVASRLFNIAKMCQMGGEMGMCFGLSGFGKTTAIKQYEKDNFGVIVIDPDEDINKRMFIINLAEKLGINPNIPIFRLEQQIVSKLKDSGKLIIVDESENLKPIVFRFLRKIHDRCNFTFGLLFVGTQRLYNNIAKMKGEFEYFTNRIAMVECLEHLKSEDVKALVSQIFPNSDNDVLKTFEAACNYNARELFNILKRTNDLIRSGNNLEPATVKATTKMLVGGSL